MKQKDTSAYTKENLFLKVFEIAGASVIVKANAPHFTVIAASNIFLEAFALTVPNILGVCFFDIFSENNNNAALALKDSFTRALAAKTTHQVSAYPLYLPAEPDPTVTYWAATNVPLLDDNGDVEYIIHTPVDVTRQLTLKHEQAARMLNLQVQQDRMNELFMKAPVGVTFLSRNNFIIEYANSAMCQMWNRYLPEEVVGKSALEVVAEVAELRTVLEKVVRSGNHFIANDAPVLLEQHGKAKTCYFDLIFEPLSDADNHITGIIGIAVDVTEKVEARLKLEDAEQRLRLATESTGLGTWDMDIASREVICSPRLAEIFGKAPGDIVSHKDMRDAIHPDDIRMVNRAFKMALETGRYFYEARIVWDDGRIRWIRTTGKVVFNSHNEPVRMLGAISDVTAQRSIIDELRTSEENLRLVTEAAELGTFDMDLLKGTLEWDKRCRELFGIYSNQPVTFDQDFALGLHPDDRQRVAAVIAQSMDKKASNGEYDVDYRTIGREDEKLRWVRAKGKVFFDENSQPIRFIGVVLDITEHKLDEIRKSDFIAMASHELKTPLTSLNAYIQLLMLKARKRGDSFLLESLQKSENQVKKMTSLIYGFLDLSRIEAGKLKLNISSFDINTVIQEVIADSTPIAPSHQIIFEPGAPLVVKADADKINQVMVNFISNAVKYSPKHSLVKVAAKQQGASVRVSVTDEGIGVDASQRQHIFERFYRVDKPETKGFSGFGIGLYISAEIIKLHKGTIGVESGKRKGSEFYFELPLA